MILLQKYAYRSNNYQKITNQYCADHLVHEFHTTPGIMLVAVSTYISKTKLGSRATSLDTQVRTSQTELIKQFRHTCQISDIVLSCTLQS